MIERTNGMKADIAKGSRSRFYHQGNASAGTVHQMVQNQAIVQIYLHGFMVGKHAKAARSSYLAPRVIKRSLEL